MAWFVPSVRLVHYVACIAPARQRLQAEFRVKSRTGRRRRWQLPLIPTVKIHANQNGYNDVFASSWLCIHTKKRQPCQ